MRRRDRKDRVRSCERSQNCRDPDRDDRAASLAIHRFHAAAMRFGNRADDREAESGATVAAARRVTTTEAVKGMRKKLRRETGALVQHIDGRPLRRGGGGP